MKKPKRKSKGTKASSNAVPYPSAGDHEARQAGKKRRRVVVGSAAVAIVAGVGAGTYFAVGGYVSPGRNAGALPTASAANVGLEYFNQAKVQIFKAERELGTMRVYEDRTAEFFLRNIGGKPLEISRVRTSCMCTFAQVVIDEEDSPLFNMEMHNAPDIQKWKGIVKPGLTATIRVTYRPSLMPVQGSVARDVKFDTNDPSHAVIELGIHATVQ